MKDIHNARIIAKIVDNHIKSGKLETGCCEGCSMYREAIKKLNGIKIKDACPMCELGSYLNEHDNIILMCPCWQFENEDFRENHIKKFYELCKKFLTSKEDIE